MALLVDVHPPIDSEPTQIELLLDACSQAAPVQCERRPPGKEAAPDAIIKWEGADYGEVQVWLNSSDGMIYRHLVFEESDLVVDRISATGLLLGALVSESLPNDQPFPEGVSEAGTEKKRAPEVDESPPARLNPRKDHSYVGSLSLLGTAGKGVGFQTGLRGEVSFRLIGPLSLYGTGAHQWETSAPQGVDMKNVELGGGLLGIWSGRVTGVEIGTGYSFQVIQASLTQSDTTEQGSSSRSGFELYAGMNLRLQERFELVLRGRLGTYPSTPKITSGGVELFFLPSLEPSAQLGIRFAY